MTLSCAKCDTEAAGTLDALPEGWQKHTSTMFADGFAVCVKCVGTTKSSSQSTGNVAADQLRLFIERIERLEEEKKGISDDIKDVYGEAKSTGYDVKTIKNIVALRKLDPHTRMENEALLETYKAALGLE